MFWSQGNSPLRQYEWYIKFDDDGLATTFSENFDRDYVHALKECSKPSYEIGFKEYKLLTQKIKYPTNLKWKPINVKMAQVVNYKNMGYLSSTDDFLIKIIESYGYYSPNMNLNKQSNEVEKEDPQQQSVKKINKNIKIIQTQDIGKSFYSTKTGLFHKEQYKTEIWNLYNPYIQNIDFGQLSYENENIVDISFTIYYDWAELEYI